MRRRNQRMVAPQVPASSCHLGETRKMGTTQARARLACVTWGLTLIASSVAPNGLAMDATGITLDNFTVDTQVDDVTLAPDVNNVYTITEAMGLRPLSDPSDPTSAAPNLFHSFFDFGLSAGEVALFTQAINDGTDPISNVISRVTGGMPSNINGTIRSEISGASFWFVNPAGVVFGDSSSIDVAGSFNASAGDFIVLEDGTTFDALTTNPLLTVSNPVDFGFLSADSGGSLTLNGVDLRGSASSNLPDRFRGLYLHGRDVTVDANSSVLTNANSAARGNIRINAAQALTINGDLLTTTKGNRTAGHILLSGQDISISDALINSTTDGRGSTGRIDLNATNDVTLDNSRLEISSNVANGGAARPISVTADGNISTTDTILVAYTESNRQISNAAGVEILPDVRLVSAGDLQMDDSTALSTTLGEANGGSVVLEATNIVVTGDVVANRLDDSTVALGRSINASTQALLNNGGNAGDVIIRGTTIALNDGARATAISAAGGDAGDVIIEASDTFSTNVGIATSSEQVFISSANQGSTNFDNNERGASGDVFISAGNRIDLNNTRLNVQRRSNRAEHNDDPSEITLTAPEGQIALNRVNAFTATRSDNDAGTLSVIAKEIDLTRTTLSSFTNGAGHSGNIVISGTDSISGDLLRAEAEAGTGRRGAAGNISITSEGDITLNDSQVVAGTQSARINRDSNGDELRASINIQTSGDLTLIDSAVVASTLTNASAGDITISARDITVNGIREVQSRFGSGTKPILGEGIEASTKSQIGAAGNGGNVSITADNLELSNGAVVLSTTDGEGNAGNIRIQVAEKFTTNTGLEVTEDNQVDTRVRISSANRPALTADRKPFLGASGQVEITAGTLINFTNTEVFTLRRSSNAANKTPSKLDISVTNGDLVADNFAFSNSTRGDNNAGTLTIRAKNINLSKGQADSFTTGRGNSDTVNIIAENNIDLTTVSLIAQSSNSTKGAAGSINVQAAGQLNVTDSAIVASTQSDRIIKENGQELKPSVTLVSGGDASFTDSSVLASTLGEAGAGSISITGDNVSISGSKAVNSIFGTQQALGEGISASALGKSDAAGDAGNVQITATNLALSNGATVTSNTAGPGNAGNIEITVSDTLSANEGLILEDNEDPFPTRVVIASTNLEEEDVAERATMGASGNVSIVADQRVELVNTQITTLRRSNNAANTTPSRVDISVPNGDLVTRGAFITSSTRGNNDAGSVNLSAENIDMRNGRLSSFTRGRGNSGSVTLAADNAINFDRMEVFTQSSNSNRGAAGSIELDANGQIDIRLSAIVASTESNRIIRRQGQIVRPNVTITSAADINLTDSAVLASTVGRAAAGSIAITGDTLRISGAKQVNSLFNDMADLGTGVSASTLGDITNAGDAGNVTITANNLELANGATINSNTGGSGDAGNIVINVADTLITNEGLVLGEDDNRDDTLVSISSANLSVSSPDEKPALGSSGTVTVSVGKQVNLNNTRVSALRRSSNPANTTPSEVRIEVADGDLIATDLQVTSATRGANEGGSVIISAKNIDLTRGELTSFTTGEGNSGSVIVNAENNLTGNNLVIGVESGNTTKGAAGKVSLTTGGDLILTDSAVVAATQSNRIINDENGEERAPEVSIQTGGLLELTDSAVLTTTVGRAAAGSIKLNADRLRVTGTREVVSVFGGRPSLGSGISASTLGQDSRAGHAGDVTVTANDIELNDGAEITSTTDGAGNAGNIIIDAANQLVTNRPGSSSADSASDDGPAEVLISSANLSVDDPSEKLGLGASGTVAVTAGSLIDVTRTRITALRRSSNPANKNPSTVNITVRDGDLIADELIASSATRGANNAGSVITSANNLVLNNSQMVSFTTGEGNSGSIALTARGDITTNGTTFGVESGNTTKGAAGAIDINAGGNIRLTDSVAVGATQSNRIVLDDAGQQRVPRVSITASGELALTDSAVLTTTVGRADAGSIDLQAESISVSGQRTFTSAFGAQPELGAGISASTLGSDANAGHAGSVTLSAERIELANGASITSTTGGTGNAGDIRITAGNSLIGNQGLIVTEENSEQTRVVISSANLSVDSPDEKLILGASGNVEIQAGALIDLTNAEITALRRSSNPENLQTSEVNISVLDGDLIARAVEFSSATRGENNGGSLNVSANNIDVTDSIFSAFTTGRGNSGSILVRANNNLVGDNFAVEVESSNGSKGAAGLIDINTGGTLTLSDSNVVAATQSNRRLLDANGNVLIPSVTITSAGDIDISDSAVVATALGNAPAGSINIKAPNIRLKGSKEVFSRFRQRSRLGEGLSASANAGGNAGTVSLVATDSLVLDGARVASQSLAAGAAGEIQLTSNTISIVQGSEVLASTEGSADGGRVAINANNVLLSDSGTRISSNARNTGNGGKVDINVTNLNLRNGARIETLAEGDGNSGNITITASGDVILETAASTAFDARSALLSESSISQGGSITANVAGELRVNNSRIESSVNGEDGTGGDINITPQALFLTSGQILAQAQQGSGGAINIGRGGDNASNTTIVETSDGLFLIDSNSIINADSEAGTNGVIAVDSPDIGANAVIAQPDDRIVSTPKLNDSLCSAEDAERSSLVLVNEGGVPPAPDSYLGAQLGLQSDSSAAREGTASDYSVAASDSAYGCSTGGE